MRPLKSASSDAAAREVRTQLRLGLQACWSYLMKKSLDVTCLSFVGHLGPLYLSAAGLALVTANVTGNAILLGLGGAQSTLCSQASGAGDLLSMNDVFQRALVVSACTCVPVGTLWLFAEPILRALGQEEELAAHAAAFMACLIPGLVFFSQSLCIQNWLFCQHKMTAPAVVISIVAALHVLWNYIFVIVLDWSYLGTAAAISVSRLAELLLLLGYVRMSGVLEETRFAWSRRCLEQWVPLFVLFYGNLLMMSELWASEVLTFLSGTIANAHVEVAAMSVYQSINSFCFQFSNGIGSVACTRVGNLLGAGDARMARRAAAVTAGITFCLTLIVSSTLILFGRYYVAVYTNDSAVVHATVPLMQVLAVYVIADGTVAGLSGVIKGLGKQQVGGRVVVFSYYAVAIPISVLLTYHWGGSINFGMGTLGLCLGTLVGTYVHFILYFLYIFWICDWTEAAEAAKARNEKMERQLNTEHCEFRAAPTKISASASDDVYNYDDLGYHSKNTFTYTFFVGIANFFSFVPGIDSRLAEESVRQGEYELVQSYTADLEEANIVLEDDDDFIFT